MMMSDDDTGITRSSGPNVQITPAPMFAGRWNARIGTAVDAGATDQAVPINAVDVASAGSPGCGTTVVDVVPNVVDRSNDGTLAVAAVDDTPISRTRTRFAAPVRMSAYAAFAAAAAVVAAT